jgi:hypothetical protein
MSIFTLVSEIENAEKKFAPQLGKIQAAEAKIQPLLTHVDPNEVEAVATPVIVAASKGKITTAEADLGIEGLFELLSIIGDIAGQLKQKVIP